MTEQSPHILTQKENDVTREVWDWIWEEISEVSDEIGAGVKGDFLLVYEGWGGFCVENIYSEDKTDEENGEAFFNYAEAKAGAVMEEWGKKYKERYTLITSGHERMNLYGVTWALFKLKPCYPHVIIDN